MTRPILDQLPGYMATDPFLQRFIGIFEEISGTVTSHAGQVDYLLDVPSAPLPVVRWLGAWLGVQVEDSLSETRQRQIVREASRLFGRRSTLPGLRALLEVLTGSTAELDDGCGIFREDTAPANPKHLVVRLESLGEYGIDQVRRAIEQEIPADVTYELWVGGEPAPEMEDPVGSDDDGPGTSRRLGP